MTRPPLDVAILAGGGGTRLWPLSRRKRPKQFLPLPFGRSLLEQTVERVRAEVPADRIWIVTVASQAAATARLLPRFDPKRILAEPIGRNSGPAACLATLQIEKFRKGPATVLLCPADHYIPDRGRFSRAIRAGARRASEGKSLVTFGLSVRAPRTDFGYIEVEPGPAKAGVRKVRRFVEKPPAESARRFARSGKHFWNSGMFAWRSDFFRREMARHAPGMLRCLDSPDWRRNYRKLANLSIDYALMEKSRRVEVVPSAFAWSDLGTWAAVYDTLAGRGRPNGIAGPGLVLNGRGNLIHSTSRPVAILGADDLVVVATPQVTMVTTREASKGLKSYLERLPGAML